MIIPIYYYYNLLLFFTILPLLGGGGGGVYYLTITYDYYYIIQLLYNTYTSLADITSATAHGPFRKWKARLLMPIGIARPIVVNA